MVRINRIYTKTGDKGETGLIGGSRVAKDSSRVACFGEVDELNAAIGICRTIAERDHITPLADHLAQIQNELFDIGSLLATPSGTSWPGMVQITAQHHERLEQWIDGAVEGLAELTSFVLPGGTLLNAHLHLARTVCRRTERAVVALARQEKIADGIVIYLNRLSDLLFALARQESKRSNTAEYLWQMGKSK